MKKPHPQPLSKRRGEWIEKNSPFLPLPTSPRGGEAVRMVIHSPLGELEGAKTQELTHVTLTIHHPCFNPLPGHSVVDRQHLWMGNEQYAQHLRAALDGGNGARKLQARTSGRSAPRHHDTEHTQRIRLSLCLHFPLFTQEILFTQEETCIPNVDDSAGTPFGTHFHSNIPPWSRAAECIWHLSRLSHPDGALSTRAAHPCVRWNHLRPCFGHILQCFRHGSCHRLFAFTHRHLLRHHVHGITAHRMLPLRVRREDDADADRREWITTHMASHFANHPLLHTISHSHSARLPPFVKEKLW